MNIQFIAALADKTFPIVAGILATLIGYRIFGPKPGVNSKIDSWHNKWLKHLKWLGPLLVLFYSLQLAQFIFTESTITEYSESNGKILLGVEESLSSDGKTAQNDKTIQSSDGFRILIPKGYTYSKPPGAKFNLVAVHDVNGIATPAFSVSVLKLDGSLERVIENTKNILVKGDSTTNFVDTQVSNSGPLTLYRITMTSLSNGIRLRGGMLIFESQGKAFTLTYGTREDMYYENVPVFKKVMASFRPHAN